MITTPTQPFAGLHVPVFEASSPVLNELRAAQRSLERLASLLQVRAQARAQALHAQRRAQLCLSAELLALCEGDLRPGDVSAALFAQGSPSNWASARFPRAQTHSMLMIAVSLARLNGLIAQQRAALNADLSAAHAGQIGITAARIRRAQIRALRELGADLTRTLSLAWQPMFGPMPAGRPSRSGEIQLPQALPEWPARSPRLDAEVVTQALNLGLPERLRASRLRLERACALRRAMRGVRLSAEDRAALISAVPEAELVVGPGSDAQAQLTPEVMARLRDPILASAQAQRAARSGDLPLETARTAVVLAEDDLDRAWNILRPRAHTPLQVTWPALPPLGSCPSEARWLAALHT